MTPITRAIFNRACYDQLETINSKHPALADGKITERELGRMEGEFASELTGRLGGSPKDFEVVLNPDTEDNFVDCEITLKGLSLFFSMGVDIGGIGGDVVEDLVIVTEMGTQITEEE